MKPETQLQNKSKSTVNVLPLEYLAKTGLPGLSIPLEASAASSSLKRNRTVKMLQTGSARKGNPAFTHQRRV